MKLNRENLLWIYSKFKKKKLEKENYASEYWHLLEIFGKEFFCWEKLFAKLNEKDFEKDDENRETTTLNLMELEKMAILKALEKADWQQKKAAEYLGVSARVLNYRIKKHNIKYKNWRINSI